MLTSHKSQIVNQLFRTEEETGDGNENTEFPPLEKPEKKEKAKKGHSDTVVLYPFSGSQIGNQRIIINNSFICFLLNNFISCHLIFLASEIQKS